MATRPIIQIDRLSGTSLRISPLLGGKPVGTATGFVVQGSVESYLLTNWHVVTGVNPATDQKIFESPDEMLIHHHTKGKLGSWTTQRELLRAADGKPRWKEHRLGKRVDVVALKLAFLEGVDLYPLDLSLADTDIVLEPAMPVSLIGYPNGLTVGGGWPVWKTGHIASDPDLDYDGAPGFLIDVTGRPGMSGSPVVLRMTGGFRTRDGSRVMTLSHPQTRFLGIYSAQYQLQELGILWRSGVIKEILGL